MTDRGVSALRQSEDALTVGPSEMRWHGDRLHIGVRERCVPHGDLLEGDIVVTPSAISNVEVALQEDGSHIWRPFAPISTINVRLNKPGWTWSGHGYFDANFGTAALEDDFRYWTWGRFPTADGATCFYDATRRNDPSPLSVALAFDAAGGVKEIETPPPLKSMSRSLWAVRRETRCDTGHRPTQVKSMLDAPFYCRSVVQTHLDGERVEGVHEALDLDRFASPWLKPMLAVKVPRRRGWRFR